MEKISAVIISFNEQAIIGRCIDSLKLVADEIIVPEMMRSPLYRPCLILKQAKRVIGLKLFSSLMGFFNGYILRLGVLDGYCGWIIACKTSNQTF